MQSASDSDCVICQGQDSPTYNYSCNSRLAKHKAVIMVFEGAGQAEGLTVWRIEVTINLSIHIFMTNTMNNQLINQAQLIK